MIRHIVMWKLKEHAGGATKAKNAEKLKLILEGLRTTIDEMKAVAVGIQISDPGNESFDVVLISDFETDLDFKMYTRHPQHKKAIDFIEKVAEQRVFVDYQVDL